MESPWPRQSIREALKALVYMQKLDKYTASLKLIKLLQKCGNMKCLEDGELVHAHILKYGCDSDVSVASTLISMYAKCGSLSRARKVFDSMHKRTVVPWNAMIGGYAKHGNSEEALKLGEQLKRQGIKPSRITFVSLLNACSNLGALRQGKSIHLEVIAAGLESDHFIESALVDMYAKSGDLDRAHWLFERMPNKTVVSWNTIIAAYSKNGKHKEALKLYERMRHEGVKLDRVTYILLAGAYGSLADLEEGKRTHSEIVSSGCESDIFVSTALIDMYAKCGSLADALQVFSSMPERNIVSWTAMIAAFVKHGSSDDALNLYRKMKQEGPKPNEVTFVSVLNACANLAALDQGKQIHAEIVEAGLESQMFVGNALIDMYGKCGSLCCANQVFNRMVKRDVISWTAIIAAYSMHGKFAESFEFFKQMQKENVKPNEVTFSSVLCVCSHLGLLDEGHKLFDLMTQEFGIVPSSQHYNCMVDLLARAGCLQEADEFVKRMPETLLKAC